MDTYRFNYRILASDVDPQRRLRPSKLFSFFQEAAIAHTVQLGFGRDKTLDRGLLWVLSLQEARILHMPAYDEDILIESEPGEMMHAFYPRYYRVVLASGETVITATALWLLMDCEKRTMTVPEATGVIIPGAAPSWDVFFPASPKLPDGQQQCSYVVPGSSLDLNGHMNNTRYLDLAEDYSPLSLLQKKLKLIRAEYSGEAKRGDHILLKYDLNDHEIRLAGFAEKRLFRLSMQYSE